MSKSHEQFLDQQANTSNRGFGVGGSLRPAVPRSVNPFPPRNETRPAPKSPPSPA